MQETLSRGAGLTASMLQRIPVILAVTAASYGLPIPARVLRWSAGLAPRPAAPALMGGATPPVPAPPSRSPAGRRSAYGAPECSVP